MKQLIQSLSSGETAVLDVPLPQPGAGQVLIRSTVSLVSLGTERMLVEFGKASYLEKARQQPEKVKMVIDKVRAEGLAPTVRAVRNKLDTPIPLGYCNVGVVAAVGRGVTSVSVGDRVASNGPHAEYVTVPVHLTAAIPDDVTDEEAAFTVIGAIGLQGIRLLAPTFGETVVVYGLGLIGLLSARLLLANGCRVIGIDIDEAKLAIAQKDGVEVVKAGGAPASPAVLDLTGGTGADAVLIAASAKADEIISEAALMSRQRGRIVLVGVVPLSLKRAEFYNKELSFQVSCSYGPGRYDPSYEDHGKDYPIGFVRWTEQRNFEAILRAISARQLFVQNLITQRVAFEDFGEVYGDMAGGQQIATLLQYGTRGAPDAAKTVDVASGPSARFGESPNGMAVIGAGNYTQAALLPGLKAAGAPLLTILSRGGLSAATLAKKFGVPKASTDLDEVLADPNIGMALVTTRHDLHARMAIRVLEAGKHVFVEKPLALDAEELDAVIAAEAASAGTVTVGFNRRFSPHAIEIKRRLREGAPVNVIATMNAGFIPPEAWVHDPLVGGGRLIGEACHYVDLISYFTGSEVVAVCAAARGLHPDATTDNASILLRYANGDLGTINYFSNGSKAYSKERVEVYSQNRTAVMDNFRRTDFYGFGGSSKLKTGLDKGHEKQFALLTERLAQGGPPLIPMSSLVNTARASIAMVESLRTKAWVTL